MQRFTCFIENTPLSDSVHSLQAVAYCLALTGQVEESIHVLDRLLSQDDGDVAWQIELAQRNRAFRAKLIEDPAAAQQQLIAWEAETTHHLGLTAFRT